MTNMQTQDSGAGMRLTRFGIAVVVLIVLAVAARFAGTRAGSAAAASGPASQAVAE